jgi:hypothetical protein
MNRHRSIAWVAGMALLGATPAVAQPQRVPADDSAQRQNRYQVGVMERVLEGAVEHGATMIRDRLQAIAPTEMLMLDTAHVRGFRLDGYGVFFDAVVPSFEGTLLWSLRALDQNNLGLESALNKLKAHIAQAGDADLQQAFRRLELQVAPMTAVARLAAGTATGARKLTGSAATVIDSPAQAGGDTPEPQAKRGAEPSASDPILNDPDDAYRTEVMRAIEDAMLDYSGALSIGDDEWLTIAARRNDERARLGQGDSDARTFLLRVRGADLNAFHARQISRDDALKRIALRVF